MTTTAEVIAHVIRTTCGFAVIAEVLGETPQVEVWGSDCLAAQMKTPAEAHQLCLAHQLRDLQRVIDGVGTAWWARAMRALFQAVLHLHHQRATLLPDQYAARWRGWNGCCASCWHGPHPHQQR